MKFISKILSIFLMIPALFGLYSNDAKDTEEAYLEKVNQIAFENTIKTAIPQTELYNIIDTHFKTPLPEGKTEKKAIVIGYDGCRADALSFTENTFSGVNKMLEGGASLNYAYCGGVNYPEVNTQDTSTAPGWCSVLTGVWADKTGITGNGITKSLEYKILMTTLVENGTIDSADFITIWGGHFDDDNSTYKLEKEYCEDNELDVKFNLCSTNTVAANTAIKDIRQTDCSDFIFAIYEGTDAAGHGFGFSTNNPIYQAGYRLNDVLAYKTITAIEERETYESEDWLIIITSDHGGIGTGHGGSSIQERMVFIVTNKEFL